MDIPHSRSDIFKNWPLLSVGLPLKSVVSDIAGPCACEAQPDAAKDIQLDGVIPGRTVNVLNQFADTAADTRRCKGGC